MQISDLKKSITQMSREEAFDLVKQTRFLRRQLPPKKARKSPTKRIKAPADPKALAAKMTKEQRMKLIAELEGIDQPKKTQEPPKPLPDIIPEISKVQKVVEKSLFHVTYFYLATGMEGRADRRDYGTVTAVSRDEAEDIVARQEYPDDLKTRDFFKGCLSAQRIRRV